jgi:hypothetical protein
MSAVILNLPQRPKPAPVREPEVPKFYCLNCDGGEFRIFSDGHIYCAGCSAHIDNLKATQHAQ